MTIFLFSPAFYSILFFKFKIIFPDFSWRFAPFSWKGTIGPDLIYPVLELRKNITSVVTNILVRSKNECTVMCGNTFLWLPATRRQQQKLNKDIGLQNLWFRWDGSLQSYRQIRTFSMCHRAGRAEFHHGSDGMSSNATRQRPWT